jgi:hypothetical protein
MTDLARLAISTYNIPNAKLKTNTNVDFLPSFNLHTCFIGIHNARMSVRMLGMA